MVDAPVQSTSDLFGDDEDFGLNERAEAVPAENRAHADRAESIDLYGDVAGVCRHANLLPFYFSESCCEPGAVLAITVFMCCH